MKDYLLNLKEKTKKELTELRKHPVKYPINITRNFAKDYWDVGTSFLTEWGISKQGLKIIQDYNPYFRVANAVATAIPVLGSKERGGRNLCLQIASWAFLIGTPAGKIGAGLFTISGLYFERKRIKKKRAKQEKASEDSLENKVE